MSLQVITGCVSKQVLDFSIGADGVATIKLDGQQRVRDFVQTKPNGEVRVRCLMDYAGNEISRARFFDAQGKRLCETRFVDEYGQPAIESSISSKQFVGMSNWTNCPTGRTEEQYWEMEGAFAFGFAQTYDRQGRLVRREFLGPNRVCVFTNLWK
jgi:hypothetical protein